jgi:nicotinate-nucleotide adenylyltransferase
MALRVAVFGGTFDPVHLGHLVTAEQCREQAALDQVWFVPAPRPPHKLERQVTSFGQRVEMLALAIAGNPCFRIDEIEKDRPGPSFMADTLEQIQQRQADLDLHLLIGSDCLPDLPHWRDPLRIVTVSKLIVVSRPGWPVAALAPVAAALGLADPRTLRMQVVQVPLIDVSSTDLRQRAREGHSLRYLVPAAVECYIREKKLYRGE